MLFELDNPRWFGICPQITPMEDARSQAKDILLYQERGFLCLPPELRYLALGAGLAYAELSFAEKLGIPSSNITLVDKQFFRGPRFPGTPSISPETTLIKSGIFEFLNNPLRRDFSVVSLFGVEFLLDTERKAEPLIKLLAGVLKSPAIVCVSPYGYGEVGKVWQANGFKSILRLPIILTYGKAQNS